MYSLRSVGTNLLEKLCLMGHVTLFVTVCIFGIRLE